jgi:hypothetical protein
MTQKVDSALYNLPEILIFLARKDVMQPHLYLKFSRQGFLQLQFKMDCLS